MLTAGRIICVCTNWKRLLARAKGAGWESAAGSSVSEPVMTASSMAYSLRRVVRRFSVRGGARIKAGVAAAQAPRGKPMRQGRQLEGFSKDIELEHLSVRQSPYAIFIDYRVKR